MSEMRILTAGGVLGSENSDWRNVSEHCLVEAVGADILGEHLGANRELLVKAALIHDWYKREEVEAMRRSGTEGYWESRGEDDRQLQEMGVPDELLQLAHANIPKHADEKYLQDRSLEEKIIFLIDMMTHETEWIDPLERQRISKQRQSVRDFSDSFRRIYDGKTLLEVLEGNAPIVQAEFETRLGLESGTLPAFLREELEKRISSPSASVQSA